MSSLEQDIAGGNRNKFNPLPIKMGDLEKEIIKFVNVNKKLRTVFNENTALFIDGVPGIGKTAIIKQICKEKGWGVSFIHYGKLGLDEKIGIPYEVRHEIFTKNVDGETIVEHINGTQMTSPDWLTSIYVENYNSFIESKKTNINDHIHLIIMDDSHLLAPDEQGDFYELITEMKTKGRELPKNCHMIMIGNFSSQLSNSKAILSGIMNRVYALSVEEDPNSWIDYVSKFDEIHPIVSTFIQKNCMEHASSGSTIFIGEESNYPWASPRSWVRVGLFLRELEENKIKINKDLLTNAKSLLEIKRCVYGNIGEEIANQFLVFVHEYTSINIDDVFKNVDSYQIPTSLNELFILTILSTRYLFEHKCDSITTDKLTKLFSKLYKTNHANLILSTAAGLIFNNFKKQQITTYNSNDFQNPVIWFNAFEENMQKYCGKDYDNIASKGGILAASMHTSNSIVETFKKK